jgi:hypothetical protein
MLASLFRFASLLVLAVTVCQWPLWAAPVSLRSAVLAPVGPTGRVAEVLQQEIDRRAQVSLAIQTNWDGKGAAIVFGSRAAIQRAHPRLAAALPAQPSGNDGFAIAITGNAQTPVVLVAGNDARGTLFAAGRLLQEMRLDRQRVDIDDAFRIASAPRYPLRGHQLGYRPKTNSYDGWDVAQWDRYIRELALFGTNAIELIPPRSDDAADSPHFPLPPLRMMREMSRIIDSYHLDCWVWFPALEKDYTDPATMANAVREWEEVFQALPRIDALFVPGGDPGHTEPKVLMQVLQRQTEVLRKYHPKATMWVSPQGFDAAWMEEFYGLLAQRPAWLKGVVYGPQNRASLSELRQRVPAQFELRHYPDITHTMRAQFPVPDWDVAYALTLQREPVNPRPVDQALIVRKVQPQAPHGFLAYSEGCNDDVNKFVWSALGWDPDADLTDVLRRYSRLLLGASLEEPFAQGLLRLEQNWRGPLLSNESVGATLSLFRQMESSATPAQKANWRFQQALYRAYYDAYVRARLLDERAREERALSMLSEASTVGSLAAIDAAQRELSPLVGDRPAAALRARVFELAEALFQSIRMQLSVERYQAISVGRGANLDLIDTPLSNAPWLLAQLASIRQEPDERVRLRRLDAVRHWTDAGPGGFYDDLGDPLHQAHLVRPQGFQDDPTMAATVKTGFSGFRANATGRISWWRVAEAAGDSPLEMRYDNLDPFASYRVRIIYGGDSNPIPIRLEADGRFEIHPYQPKNMDFTPVEFAIPREATSDGALTLRFTRPSGLGGNGRGVQVCEVWLLREEMPSPTAAR